MILLRKWRAFTKQEGKNGGYSDFDRFTGDLSPKPHAGGKGPKIPDSNLPTYSPELNPLEEAWSLIKATFKSLEARTILAYADALKIAKRAVTPEKIRAYFSHADSFIQSIESLVN